MWKSSSSIGSVLQRMAKKPSVQISLGAAASLVALLELDYQLEQQQHRHEQRVHQRGSGNDAPERNRNKRKNTARHPFSLAPVTLDNHDDGTKSLLMATSSSVTLRQRGTLARIQHQSTRASMNAKYDVNRSQPLGRGSFGSVYLATDRRTGEKVAIKKIPKKYTNEEQFQKEMEALMYLQSTGGHPGICSLREHFSEGGSFYIVLDLVSGGELFDHLVKHGAFSEADAARLVREAASALAFLHGVGVVHGDVKPENLLLSSTDANNAVIKLVDFGNARVFSVDDYGNEYYDDDEDDDSSDISSDDFSFGGITIAYCPPEILAKRQTKIEPSMDMWAMGVILYIMLTGLHPFDLRGRKTDKEFARSIRRGQRPPLKNSPITAHLSDSAIDLIDRLLDMDPEKRLDANEMLEHPWVKGETATRSVIQGSDKKLSMYRKYKSGIEATVFSNLIIRQETLKRTSLIEQSFKFLDPENKGHISQQDLKSIASASSSNNNKNSRMNNDEESGDLSLSGFSDLLSENMKNKFFPKGHIIYREGDIGNHMYFINSGKITVETKEGSSSERGPGDFFGEGALLHPKKIRSATVQSVTPVHAMQISREYFDKYLEKSDKGLLLELREKDKIRKRNRAKTILRLQSNLKEKYFQPGEVVFKAGDNTDSIFIVETGKVDNVAAEDSKNIIFSAKYGNICGEHSPITGKPRNCTAVCASENGCTVHELSGSDFRKLMDVSPDIKASLRDLMLRRDFKKAVVKRLKKEFPYDNPREAFDAVKDKRSSWSVKKDDGTLNVREVGKLMRELNPEYTDEEILEVIRTMDLQDSGSVTFDEFKKVFVADVKASASI